jgi:hypothetical protein
MTWALMIAASAWGVAIGLLFRVPALIAASVLVAAIGLGVGLLSGNILLAAFRTGLALSTLQIGYLAGLALTCGRNSRR